MMAAGLTIRMHLLRLLCSLPKPSAHAETSAASKATASAALADWMMALFSPSPVHPLGRAEARPAATMQR